jgi:hypothetical protein
VHGPVLDRLGDGVFRPADGRWLLHRFNDAAHLERLG